MEAHIFNLQTMKEMLKAARGLEGEFMAVFAPTQGSQDWHESFGQGASKRAAATALRRFDGDGFSVKVDKGHVQPSLAEAQAGMQANEKRKAQPFRLFVQGGQGAVDLVVGEFALGLGLVLGNAEPLDGGKRDVSSESALAKNETEEFGLLEGRVFRADLAASAAAGAPGNVVVPVPVSDLARVPNASKGQPMGNVAPVQLVNLPGEGRSAMADQPARDPAPIVGRRGRAGRGLGKRHLRANDLCLRGLGLRINAQLGGLPLDGAIQGIPQPPKGRTRAFVERGHASVSVCFWKLDFLRIPQELREEKRHFEPQKRGGLASGFNSRWGHPLFTRVYGPSVLSVCFFGPFLFMGGVVR